MSKRKHSAFHSIDPFIPDTLQSIAVKSYVVYVVYVVFACIFIGADYYGCYH